MEDFGHWIHHFFCLLHRDLLCFPLYYFWKWKKPCSLVEAELLPLQFQALNYYCNHNNYYYYLFHSCVIFAFTIAINLIIFIQAIVMYCCLISVFVVFELIFIISAIVEVFCLIRWNQFSRCQSHYSHRFLDLLLNAF